MRTIFIFLITVFVQYQFVAAQAPQAMNYQAGVYDASGMPLANHSIGLRTSILDTSAAGPVLYSESFATTTDANGFFNVNLGTGTVISGSFPAIDWSNGNKWLKTEIDTGSGFILMGATKFLSVPYALYAEKSNSNLSGFGQWAKGFQTDTVYQAQTDGFLNVSDSINNSVTIGGCYPLTVYSDSSAAPTTIMAQSKIVPDHYLVPIRKNDYWEVVKGNCNNNTIIFDIRWLPLR